MAGHKNGISLTAGGSPVYKASGAGGKPYVSLPVGCLFTVSTNATINSAVSDGQFTYVAFARNIVAATWNIIMCGSGAGDHVRMGATNAASNGSTYGLGVPNGTYPWNNVGDANIQMIGASGKAGIDHLSGFAIANGAVISANYGAGTVMGAQNGTFSFGYPNNSSFTLQGDFLGGFIFDRDLTPNEIMQLYKWACEQFAQATAQATFGRILAGFGDSEMFGATISSPMVDNWLAQLARDRSIPMGCWMNFGQTGRRTGLDIDPWAQVATQSIPRIVGVPAHALFFEYANIFTDTSSLPETQNLTMVSHLAAAGWSRIGLIDRQDDSGLPARDTTYLAALASGYLAAGASDLITLSQSPDVGVHGAYANATYFTDGRHCTSAGHTKVKEYVKPTVTQPGWGF